MPLTAVFSHKMRLVVDASQGLNEFLEKRDVVLEDLTTLSEIVEEEDWIAVDNFDSGYWHVALRVISVSKMMDPSQEPVFLGTVIDTLGGFFHVPQAKVTNILEGIMEKLLVLNRMPVRELASMVGKLIAGYRSLGKNLTGLMSKGCYRDISKVGYRWESRIRLSDETKVELRWWRDNLVRVNKVGMLMKTSPGVLTIDYEFAGEAHGDWGGSLPDAIQRG